MALVKQNNWRPPLVRQHDVSDCGAACLASVFGFYGLHMAVARIRQLTVTDQQGTSVLGLVEAAIQSGFHAKGIKATYESMKITTLPAIVHVITDDKMSHFMVLVKVNDTRVLVMDPAEGKIRRITQGKFREIWTGVAVLMLPGEKMIKVRQKRTFDKITAIIRPYRKSLMLAALCAVMVSILALTVSVYVRVIVDGMLVKQNFILLNIISIIALLLVLMYFLISIIKNVVILKTGRAISSSLINEYYGHVLQLPQSFFDNMRVGEMLSRINDAVKITAFIHDFAVNLVVDVLIIIFSLVFMFTYSWKVSAIISSVAGIYALLYYLSNRINQRYQRGIAVAAAELDTSLIETLGAATTIRHLGLEKFFKNKVAVKLSNLSEKIYSSSVWHSYIQMSADLAGKIYMILLLWIGSLYVAGNELTPGQLISFYTLLGWITGPVLYLLAATKTFTEAKIASERLFEIMELAPRENGWKKLSATRDICINFIDVQFTYGNNEPLLKNINLYVPAGKITGISGKSGSGKSTLASLLLRSYKVQGGTIKLNGIDINEIEYENLTRLISVVRQQPDLFSGSILENIMLGREKNDIRMSDICERLGITAFTSYFPKGMNTMVAEQAGNLSGGQKQRIAIARALFRNAPVLILDEATVSIDSVSEQKIMQTIEWYKRNGNTVIIIAHSETTLKICDNIAVLDDGVIR
ncbi:MAG TPA: peptidase domain-containing ABC transporter [Flavitalea sp.]|nr:peptidase domain-containing ABC transporter [Flavitalea sp.]